LASLSASTRLIFQVFFFGLHEKNRDFKIFFPYVDYPKKIRHFLLAEDLPSCSAVVETSRGLLFLPHTPLRPLIFVPKL